ncbi:hypothetical protein QOZ80_5BG0429970 [Eleusine coracana subsp. coracana]|nr:hypothetical protein QOZ80_5BG0429970 [Eleusine coracana subsp. coracana]
MIMLKSSDGEEFEIEEAVAMESQTTKHMIEDDCTDNGIPLPNVTATILSKVIEYCKKQVEAKAKAKVESNNDELLLTVADMMKGKSPEEIRKTFNIMNDFTHKEEDEIRRENQWTFD